VAVVPFLDDGRIVLERQYRHATRQVMIEIPAGKLDAGEAPQDCARREMVEETGYEVARLALLCTLHPVISYSTETIHCFIGEGLRQVGARLDHGEFLEVEAMRLEALLAALDRGEITDAKTDSALLLYQRKARR
jgi:ADP-ribose pyrophosphatase